MNINFKLAVSAALLSVSMSSVSQERTMTQSQNKSAEKNRSKNMDSGSRRQTSRQSMVSRPMRGNR